MLHALSRLLVIAAVGAAVPQSAASQRTAPAGVVSEDTTRIGRIVLKGLRPKVEIVGRPTRWTLEERMAEHDADRIDPVVLDAEAASGIAGTYLLRIESGRSVEVRLDDGRLTMYGPRSMVQELVPESDTRFVNPVAGWRFEFIREPSGQATAVRVFRDNSGEPVEGSRTK